MQHTDTHICLGVYVIVWVLEWIELSAFICEKCRHLAQFNLHATLGNSNKNNKSNNNSVDFSFLAWFYGFDKAPTTTTAASVKKG